jgi:hypothetical protein
MVCDASLLMQTFFKESTQLTVVKIWALLIRKLLGDLWDSLQFVVVKLVTVKLLIRLAL